METNLKILGKIWELQNKIEPIVKDKPGGNHGNKYFDVNVVAAEVKKHAKELGLGILQPLTNVDGKLAIQTIIYDKEDGSSLAFPPAPIPVLTVKKTDKSGNVSEGEDPMSAGSSITYFRRYCLVSFLLIEGEEDNDLQDKPIATSKASMVSDPKNAKMCPSCDKVHEGKYAKCIECWKKDKEKNVGAIPQVYNL